MEWRTPASLFLSLSLSLSLSTWKRDLERLKGPCMLLNECAIVVASLPAQRSQKYGTRPWCLLLTSSGELGWCYALDGLEILSPAREVGETFGNVACDAVQ